MKKESFWKITKKEKLAHLLSKIFVVFAIVFEFAETRQMISGLQTFGVVGYLIGRIARYVILWFVVFYLTKFIKNLIKK